MRSRSSAATTQRANIDRAGVEAQNPRVSRISRFRDVIWKFCAEMPSPTHSESGKRIPWDFMVALGESFCDPKFASLMLACKQLLYILMWDPEENRSRNKPITIIHLWRYLRHFVLFLTNRPYPILRFRDVTKHVVDEYLKSLRLPNKKGKKRTNPSLLGYYYVLKFLYLYRHKITDSIQFDPLDGDTPSKKLGVTFRSWQARTEAIPDELLPKLITSAIDYVFHFSDLLIQINETTDGIREEYSGLRKKVLERRLRIWFEQNTFPTEVAGTSFSLGAIDRFTLGLHLARLRTACFILIAFVTGMRLSEILSLEEGCVETEITEDGEFIWLRSRLYKTQDKDVGTPAKWLAGPFAAKAVSVLERLTARLRRAVGTKQLFVPVTKWGRRSWAGEAVAAATITKDLQNYVEWLDLRDPAGNLLRLHAHMFRRTFARHAVRSDTTNLLALKSHFKHVSLAMTDLYVGVDEELHGLLNDEADRLSFESFDKLLRSDQLAGPRGKELVRQIDAAIADGRLPPEFRGEAGAHLRKEMIFEMVAAGQQVYPCATGNFCWFRKGSALCTEGDRPVVERCNPVGCSNSAIHPEHEPCWRENQEGAEKLLRYAPPGSPLSLRLHQIIRISKKIRRDIV